ncbi:hypothetical protein PHJA_000625900 [Phtheirospermum japonicum]|uniref:Uncharacterized protein n=1 Tax=Phtheirospermum japonicum TaxID=374723 RepID=A0A830BS52_9LAMI|nr:hypothetical protein PHJA_000625900 [Phtheirospermum japonicum]
MVNLSVVKSITFYGGSGKTAVKSLTFYGGFRTTVVKIYGGGFKNSPRSPKFPVGCQYIQRPRATTFEYDRGPCCQQRLRSLSTKLPTILQGIHKAHIEPDGWKYEHILSHRELW